MNGPGMFNTKPYYDYSKAHIELPSCMFKMKNVHGTSSSSQNGQDQHDQPRAGLPPLPTGAGLPKACVPRPVSYCWELPDREQLAQQASHGITQEELAALEFRQVNILQELRALETEVSTLAVRLKTQDEPAAVTPKATQTATKAPPASQKKATGKLTATKSVPAVDLGNVIHDLVIYANPNSPPLSLFVLYHTLRSQYRCRSAVHVHSSVKNVPDTLLQSLGNGVEVGRHEAQIGITLIWKDVSHGPELKVSANSQTPIQGEANVARYLARLISPRYDAGPVQHVCAIDDLLDLASFNILSGSSKERAAALRSLNSTLGKSTWLAPTGEVSVADAVVWSALTQAQMINGAPGNVQKWLMSCATQSAFKFALDAL